MRNKAVFLCAGDNISAHSSAHWNTSAHSVLGAPRIFLIPLSVPVCRSSSAHSANWRTAVSVPVCHTRKGGTGAPAPSERNLRVS
jgi:hypothetical protein